VGTFGAFGSGPGISVRDKPTSYSPANVATKASAAKVVRVVPVCLLDLCIFLWICFAL